jgi:putative intracellular protease/amidase
VPGVVVLIYQLKLTIMKKRILIIASSANHIGPNNRTTGSFLTEIAHPYETFKKQGYEVDIVSVNGGEAPLDGMFEKDEALNTAFLTGDGLQKMKNTTAISKVEVTGYDAVFVPGGLAPMVDMPDNDIVHEAIASTFERGGVVGAVCHGPVSLLNVILSDGTYLVNGKNITSFSNAEEDNYAKADVPFMLESALRERGANYTSAAPWQTHVIEDGKLVTGQNPASAKGVAEKMIDILESAKA